MNRNNLAWLNPKAPVPRMRGDEPATKERLADQDYPAALDRKLGLIVVLHTNGR